jgi:hypothetical protein
MRKTGQCSAKDVPYMTSRTLSIDNLNIETAKPDMIPIMADAKKIKVASYLMTLASLDSVSTIGHSGMVLGVSPIVCSGDRKKASSPSLWPFACNDIAHSKYLRFVEADNAYGMSTFGLRERFLLTPAIGERARESYAATTNTRKPITSGVELHPFIVIVMGG